MMAKNTMLSKARLLLTALEPRAIPSARACMHRPIVVFDRPFGVSGLGFGEETRSRRGDVGKDDIGIEEVDFLDMSNGGRNVKRCMII